MVRDRRTRNVEIMKSPLVIVNDSQWSISYFQEQRTTELAESTDKIANLEFELKQAQDKLSSFEVEKSNFAAINDQRILTIQNMEVQERFWFCFESSPPGSRPSNI